MPDHDARAWVDALKRVRTELELALKENADWRALRRVRSRTRRAAHEQSLASDPIYRAWSLLSRIVQEMRAGAAPSLPEVPEGRDVPQDGEVGAIRAGSERSARRRRVSLREVLERVRSDATLDRAPVEPAAGEIRRPAENSAQRQSVTRRIGLPDPEEAAVSFVVREPVEPAADPEHPAEGSGEASAPGGLSEPEDADRAAGSQPAGGGEEEAEVVIVPRPR